jgi:hypothetical protein
MKHLFVATILALQSFGVLAQSGYVHGANHCFHFASPEGWVLDNVGARNQGVPMVLYPAGESWEKAESVMYSAVNTVSARNKTSSERIKESVESVIRLYQRGPNGFAIKAEKMSEVRGQGGAIGEFWAFTGYPRGAREAVVYFAGLQTVNYFVLQAPSESEYQKNRPKLVELSSTYREEKVCVPCTRGKSCIEPSK